MKILHFCQFKLAHSNGVQAAVWTLSVEQAKRGCSVEIISLGRLPTEYEQKVSKDFNVSLIGFKGVRGLLGLFLHLKKIANLDPNLIAHLHSVFIPFHYAASLICRSLLVPYVVSPHGNIARMELSRKWLRKSTYIQFILRTKLDRAQRVVCVSKREMIDVSLIAQSAAPVLLGNGLSEAGLVDIVRKHDPLAGITGLSLGKSDVENKAYDLMFEAASCFSGGVDFHVVPYQQDDHYEKFLALASRYENDQRIRVNAPVYGEDKLGAFAKADCFLHLARWEVFGMVLIEAALAGLPIIVADTCDLASEIEAAGAGISVSLDNGDYLKEIQLFLNSEEFQVAGRRARDWAMEFYTSEAVALRSLGIYKDVWQG